TRSGPDRRGEALPHDGLGATEAAPYESGSRDRSLRSTCGAVAQPANELRHVDRKRRLERQRTAVCRVTEPELPRVQRLTLERDLLAPVSLDRVALFSDEGMSAQLRLQADLIAFAADEPHFEERAILEFLDDGVAALRIAPAPGASR